MEFQKDQDQNVNRHDRLIHNEIQPENTDGTGNRNSLLAEDVSLRHLAAAGARCDIAEKTCCVGIDNALQQCVFRIGLVAFQLQTPAENQSFQNHQAYHADDHGNTDIGKHAHDRVSVLAHSEINHGSRQCNDQENIECRTAEYLFQFVPHAFIIPLKAGLSNCLMRFAYTLSFNNSLSPPAVFNEKSRLKTSVRTAQP